MSLPPVTFLLANVLASIYCGAQGQTAPAPIIPFVAGARAYITLPDALTGVVPGRLYIAVLSPLLGLNRHILGDYVPTGQTLTSFGSGILGLFLADVLFAPFVAKVIPWIWPGPPDGALQSTRSDTHFLCFLWSAALGHGFRPVFLAVGKGGGLFVRLLTWCKNVIAPFRRLLGVQLGGIPPCQAGYQVKSL
jgi:predicted membrane protein